MTSTDYVESPAARGRPYCRISPDDFFISSVTLQHLVQPGSGKEGAGIMQVSP